MAERLTLWINSRCVMHLQADFAIGIGLLVKFARTDVHTATHTHTLAAHSDSFTINRVKHRRTASRLLLMMATVALESNPSSLEVIETLFCDWNMDLLLSWLICKRQLFGRANQRRTKSLGGDQNNNCLVSECLFVFNQLIRHLQVNCGGRGHKGGLRVHDEIMAGKWNKSGKIEINYFVLEIVNNFELDNHPLTLHRQPDTQKLDFEIDQLTKLDFTYQLIKHTLNRQLQLTVRRWYMTDSVLVTLITFSLLNQAQWLGIGSTYLLSHLFGRWRRWVQCASSFFFSSFSCFIRRYRSKQPFPLQASFYWTSKWCRISLHHDIILRLRVEGKELVWIWWGHATLIFVLIWV